MLVVNTLDAFLCREESPRDDVKWLIEQVVLVGRNRHGYQFAVGRIGERWVGFARCENCQKPPVLWIFPEVATCGKLGVTSRDGAILMTGAIAQDPVHGYGGISGWCVPSELRGNPDDYRCHDCGDVGCQGECHAAEFDWDDSECGGTT